jgi:hypothetical protein
MKDHSDRSIDLEVNFSKKSLLVDGWQRRKLAMMSAGKGRMTRSVEGRRSADRETRLVNHGSQRSAHSA